jgi:tetratricopeptide (TPR) repeat protein
MLNYGTATQTTGAYLLKGECLQQLGQFAQAQESFEQGIAMAEKSSSSSCRPMGSICWFEAATCNSIPMAPRPLLDKLDKLLANPDLKESQLQVYSRCCASTPA